MVVNIKIIEEWLKKANEDFRFASCSLEDLEDKFYAQILFHFQQAAEKYLKGYMLYLSIELKKIHDLVELLEIIKKEDAEIVELMDEVDMLNDYYIETRYPAHWPTGYTKKLCEEARGVVKKIKEWVEGKIEK
ncbi:HEPN domain-containing protein [Patescibacteria group bacterium]|nr:HEPN domain-containing protein [Patescibacteria group bacterium]MBU4265218.1 HEPN domain-containing protein [Patescibacteria group bacterium]MBU4389916.1 HEPN domain-containing protein [Patescibacteria group bacterium]MCG2701599.1 HEPN domain-containing protein [Candidatus Parcubacteria bacterium]